MGTTVKPSLDTLFSTEESTASEITEMSFDEMKDLAEHQFELYTGQRLQNMVDSIRRNGIMQPLLLWHHEGEYYLLSGYNRRNAGKLAGLDRGPIRIFEELSKADAISIMIETNLYQRSFKEMNPLEKAYCLAEHHKLTKCQGKRNDLIVRIAAEYNTAPSDNQTEFRSDRAVGAEYNLTRDKASKYIHIGNSELSASLQELFRQNKIPLTQTYHISFLDRHFQEVTAELFEKHKVGPTVTKQIKELFQKGELTEEILRAYFEKSEQKIPLQPYTLSKDTVSEYFSGTSKSEMDRIIKEALHMYFENSK